MRPGAIINTKGPREGGAKSAGEILCCGHGSETIVHTIFECPKLDDVRGDFFQKLETIFLQKLELETNAATDCLALLMGDDPPQEIENSLYRFLTSLFKRRLGILAAQGEGL